VFQDAFLVWHLPEICLIGCLDDIQVQRHVWPLGVIPHHQSIKVVLEPGELALDRPEESLGLSVCLRMGHPRQDLAYLVLDEIPLEDRRSSLPLLCFVRVELYPPVSEYRGRLPVLLDGLLQHLDRMLRCGFGEQTI